MSGTGLTTLALGLAMQVGTPAPSETPNYPPLQNAFSQHGFEGQYEQRYPFDTQQNWVHGYFQEIPAYGGHVFYRPYNYKDVLSQSQTAAGWGMSPTMPYSQQFWHRYHDQATMLKLSRTTPQPTAPMAYPVMPAGAWGMQPQMTPPVQGYAAPQGYWPAQTTQMVPMQAMPVQQPVYYTAPPTTAPAGPLFIAPQ
jgi:hypothetical protein